MPTTRLILAGDINLLGVEDPAVDDIRKAELTNWRKIVDQLGLKFE